MRHHGTEDEQAHHAALSSLAFYPMAFPMIIGPGTITTIVVFLPIVYLHGSAGELFKDQAWTVAFSLFSSLIVAVLVRHEVAQGSIWLRVG